MNWLLTLPEMMPLASPGMPSISEKLLELKYSSQVVLSSGLWQNALQRSVVFSSTIEATVETTVGPAVLFSSSRVQTY